MVGKPAGPPHPAVIKICLLALLLCSSCSVDLGLSDYTFACASDQECALGKTCDRASRTCVSPSVDAGVSESDAGCGFDERHFDLEDDELWQLNPSAIYQAGLVSLTWLLKSRRGTMWHKRRIFAQRFTLETDFSIGGGTGGDGMAVAWIEEGPAARSTGGGHHGVIGLTGYLVELDTVFNSSMMDPPTEHVALIRTTPAEMEIIATSTSIPPLRNTATPQTLTVVFDDGFATVLINEKLIFTATIADYTPFDATFGAGAATGSLIDTHDVHRMTLICR